MTDWVTDAVDRHVEALEEERLPDGKWHPSSISGPCVRKAVLEKNGVPFVVTPDPQTKRVFRIGHIFHKFVQDAVSKDPNVKLSIPEIDIEIPLWDVVGTADVLVLLKSGSYELIEIKSIKDAGLNYALPKPDHLIQATIYAYALREHGGSVENMKLLPLGERLDSIRVVYVGKETMQIKEKVIKYTPELEASMLSRIDAVLRSDRRFVDSARMPPEIDAFDRSKTWYYNYCPYRGSGVCCGDR